MCNILEDLELPKMKPRWVDITDGGPGVAVSNFDVRFRDCEMARMWKSDYRLRIHLSWNDSHSNEAESSNSAIADSVVDGGTIDWEKVKLFDNLSDAEISAMSINDFDAHQRQRMHVNACSVQKEIVKRIDGAPCLNEYIKAFETPDPPFFFNKKLLYKHHNSSESGNPNIPGQNYFRELVPGDKQKVKEFSDVFIVEERYVEEYLTHLMNLKRTKKRKGEAKAKGEP